MATLAQNIGSYFKTWLDTERKQYSDTVFKTRIQAYSNSKPASAMRIQIQPGLMKRREFKVNGGRRETSAGRDPPRECPEFHYLQCLESIFILNWTLEEQEPNIQIRSFEEMRKCNLCKYGEIQDGHFELKLNWRQRADGRLQKEETHHENVLNADLQPWKQRSQKWETSPGTIQILSLVRSTSGKVKSNPTSTTVLGCEYGA